MESVALGVRMHSGWGVLVTVGDEAEVVDRRRFVIVSDDAPGGKMPFHHAEKLGLGQAEAYLSRYTAECDRVARQAIKVSVDELKARGYYVDSAAIVPSSGRTLPDLSKILGSHPLIHSAEGDLFESVREGPASSSESELWDIANGTCQHAQNKYSAMPLRKSWINLC